MKKSIFNIFNKGLRKTAVSFSRRVGGCFSNIKAWNEKSFEELEAALISSDFGISSTLKIVDNIRDDYENGKIKSKDDIISVAKSKIIEIINQNSTAPNLKENGLNIILLVGVNGCGKTTTAGKLADKLRKENKKVMLAACDTFRAAAADQLKLWGEKTGSYVVSSKHGADPSAVAFDAVKAALSRNYDFLIIDTAGRQHTKQNLMDELTKMNRSISKAYPGAPNEIWLVIDGSIGSNALAQAREFINSINATGFICTKLDGSGKGGMIVAIKDEFKIPIYYIGLGEQPDDLQTFNPELYTNALFEEI